MFECLSECKWNKYVIIIIIDCHIQKKIKNNNNNLYFANFDSYRLLIIRYKEYNRYKYICIHRKNVYISTIKQIRKNITLK